MQEEISQKRPREEENNQLSQTSQNHGDKGAKKVKETRDNSTQTPQQIKKPISIQQITKLCKMEPKPFMQELKKIGNPLFLNQLYLSVYDQCSGIEKAYLSRNYSEGSKCISNLQESTIQPITKELMTNIIKDKSSQSLVKELSKMVDNNDYTWNKRCDSIKKIIQECVKLEMPEYLEKMHSILNQHTSRTAPSKMRDSFLTEQNKLKEIISNLKQISSQDQTSETSAASSSDTPSSASSSDMIELEINDAAHGLLALGGATWDSDSDNVN
ncbi:hypothetical protein [Candidatus Phycorickettsia trachydisci]|nr:hypothetical protein [Candidatus Phycorickettsia trachydisci]